MIAFLLPRWRHAMPPRYAMPTPRVAATSRRDDAVVISQRIDIATPTA